MLDSLKFLDDLKLENLDLAALKIPKNAIYLMIAFKLINNLDKIVPQLRNLARPSVPIPIHRPVSTSSSMPLLVVFLLIGGVIILANNLLDRVNISLMSCGVGALKDSNLKMPESNYPMRKYPINTGKCPINTGKCPINTGKCPINTGKCPIRKCPIFSKCPMKGGEECPMKSGKCPINTGKCPIDTGKCPMKKGIRSCPLFSNDIEKKLMELMEENDKLQQELSDSKKKNVEAELLENTE